MSKLPKNWDRMSLPALWEALNAAPRLEAAKSTCDALLYELRTLGVAALAGPNCKQRLSALSTKQLRDLIAALMRLRPQYPAITDDLLLKLGELL
jgi:hypothetical protein